MMNALLIVAGVFAMVMGITGRYREALAALVTGWAPNASANR